MVGPARQKELGLPGASWQGKAVWHATDIQEAMLMPSSAKACQAVPKAHAVQRRMMAVQVQLTIVMRC